MFKINGIIMFGEDPIFDGDEMELVGEGFLLMQFNSNNRPYIIEYEEKTYKLEDVSAEALPKENPSAWHIRGKYELYTE